MTIVGGAQSVSTPFPNASGQTRPQTGMEFIDFSKHDSSPSLFLIFVIKWIMIYDWTRKAHRQE